jgi:hypothetical protein
LDDHRAHHQGRHQDPQSQRQDLTASYPAVAATPQNCWRSSWSWVGSCGAGRGGPPIVPKLARQQLPPSTDRLLRLQHPAPRRCGFDQKYFSPAAACSAHRRMRTRASGRQSCPVHCPSREVPYAALDLSKLNLRMAHNSPSKSWQSKNVRRRPKRAASISLASQLIKISRYFKQPSSVQNHLLSPRPA